MPKKRRKKNPQPPKYWLHIIPPYRDDLPADKQPSDIWQRWDMGDRQAVTAAKGIVDRGEAEIVLVLHGLVKRGGVPMKHEVIAEFRQCVVRGLGSNERFQKES